MLQWPKGLTRHTHTNTLSRRQTDGCTASILGLALECACAGFCASSRSLSLSLHSPPPPSRFGATMKRDLAHKKRRAGEGMMRSIISHPVCGARCWLCLERRKRRKPQNRSRSCSSIISSAVVFSLSPLPFRLLPSLPCRIPRDPRGA